MTHTGADGAPPARRRRRSIFRDDSDDLGLRDHWGDPTSDVAAVPTVAPGPAAAAVDVATDDPDVAPSIFRAGLPDTTAADPGRPDGSAR